MVRYNADQIISVDWFDVKPDPRYTFQVRKTFCGITTRKEGFFFDSGQYCGAVGREDSLPPTHFLRDGIVYRRPYMVVNLADGSFICERCGK